MYKIYLISLTTALISTYRPRRYHVRKKQRNIRIVNVNGSFDRYNISRSIAYYSRGRVIGRVFWVIIRQVHSYDILIINTHSQTDFDNKDIWDIYSILE